MSMLFLLLAAVGEGALGLLGSAACPLLAPLISVFTLAGPPLPLLLAPLLAPLAGTPGCQIPPFQWRY